MSFLKQLALEAQRGGLIDLGRALIHLGSRSGIGDAEVVIDNPQDGEVIAYDAVGAIWTNKQLTPEETGDYQPLNAILTAFSGMPNTAGIPMQIDADTFTKIQIGTGANDVAAGNHNHDDRYSLNTHNHDAAYAAIGHNHDADYISIISEPVLGNFPTMTGTGELNTSSYSPSSFVSTSLPITATASVSVSGSLSTSLTFTLLNDVLSPGNNKIYGTNASGIKGWYDAPAGGGSSTLDGLTDVTITSAQDDQYLRYDSATSQWINETVTQDATLTALADLNDTAGVLYQTGADTFEKRAIGTTPNTIAAGDHVHTNYATTATQIATQHSLTGGGNLSASRTLSLVGDTASPGANKVYATGADGVRTWRDGIFSTEVPTGLTSVASISALRSIASPADGAPIYVRYHTSVDDGGGGLFYFDASVTQTRMVTAATIANGGTGYSANTLLRVSGGTSSRVARALITAVSGGVVTSIILIDSGNYTVDPTTSGAATTNSLGTGCTLNLTMGKYDNRGTLIAPNDTSTGMWRRSGVGRESNVRHFGARGFFSGDDRQAIQNAINAAGANGLILLGGGRYICPNTLYLESGQTLKGEANYGTASQLWGSNAGAPVIKTNDSINDPQKIGIEISDITFGATNAPPYYIQLLYTTRFTLRNLTFSSNVSIDCIHVNTTWGSTISDCSFGGGAQALIHFTRTGSHGGNHAITINNCYSSSGAQYGLLLDSTWGTCSVNTRVNDCTFQGATVAQVALLSVDGASINGLYTEAGARPILLGDAATNQSAVSVHISGCTFMTYGTLPPRLSSVANVTISGSNLNLNGVHSVWLEYDKVSNVNIIGCSPGNFHSGVRRAATATNGITIIRSKTSTEGADITMLASGGSAHQHYRMAVNGSGQWVATEWIPTSL